MQPECRRCVLCLSKCSLSVKRYTNRINVKNEIPELRKTVASRGTADEDDSVKEQLQIIFLLRKILEIPQYQCCNFLQNFGHPSSWIDCCGSCSVLVEEAKTIFGQILTLQNNFNRLQNEIKNKIIDTAHIEEHINEREWGVKERIRSFFNDAISKEIMVDVKEEAADDFSSSDWNTTELIDPNSDFLQNDRIEEKILPLDWHTDLSHEEIKHGNGSEGQQVNDFTCEDYAFDSGFQKHLNPSGGDKVDNFGRTDEYLEHGDMHGHSAEKPYKCSICGKGFLKSRNLKRHERIHTGEKPNKCSICGMGFLKSSNLKRHERSHTGEKPSKCDICGKGFVRPSTLRSHLTSHTGEKPFECHICGKRINTSYDLKRHLKTHAEEKPFECEICGKRVASSRNLKSHLKVHTGESLFTCDICGKGIHTSYDLKRHMKIHTDEKPFECEICGKRLTSSRNLKGHLKLHTGESLLTCDICGRSFTQSSVLKTHLRTHTGE